MLQSAPEDHQHYFPMMLSNGEDAVLINYNGSMVSGITGHSHLEEFQGTACGWYKIGHVLRAAKNDPVISPILDAGYNLVINGEVCEPDSYLQSFDPKTATLLTEISAWSVRCRIESFLNDDHILVERYKILEIGSKAKSVRLELFFRQIDGREFSRVFANPISIGGVKANGNGIDFSYSTQCLKGCGSLSFDKKVDGYLEGALNGVYYENLKKNFQATRFLVLADKSDSKNYRKIVCEAKEKIDRLGYLGLKRKHQKIWKNFFAASNVLIDDEKIQDSYDLGLYMLRANQHRHTGAITCGQLPHLWGGGTCCPYDTEFMHHALMFTNHLAEGEQLLNFYKSQRKAGKEIARDNGLSGAIYSGWANCFGEDKTTNLQHHVLHYKPMMSGFIALSYYWQWMFAPHEPNHKKNIPIILEILELASERFIDEHDTYAIMKPSMACNESYVEVENDTLTSLVYARAFAGLSEMCSFYGVNGYERYQEISQKLYKGLEDNYVDGVLMPYKNAMYQASMQFDFFIWNLPDGINKHSLYASLEDSRTKWGLDTVQPSERYRDWPWLGSRLSLALSHIGDSCEAFKWMKHPMKYASSNGAIPEKIRMDGYPIGYWYPTPFAILVWSVIAGLCHIHSSGNLRLLYGFNGETENISFSNIRLPGGLLIDCEVKNKRIIRLEIINTANKEISLGIDVNNAYAMKKVKTVTISSTKKKVIVG